MQLLFKLDTVMQQRGIGVRELAKQTDIRPATIMAMRDNTAIRVELAQVARLCLELDLQLEDLLELKK